MNIGRIWIPYHVVSCNLLRWASLTRYMLWRNTACTMKGLFFFVKTTNGYSENVAACAILGSSLSMFLKFVSGSFAHFIYGTYFKSPVAVRRSCSYDDTKYLSFGRCWENQTSERLQIVKVRIFKQRSYPPLWFMKPGDKKLSYLDRWNDLIWLWRESWESKLTAVYYSQADYKTKKHDKSINDLKVSKTCQWSRNKRMKIING